MLGYFYNATDTRLWKNNDNYNFIEKKKFFKEYGWNIIDSDF